MTQRQGAVSFTGAVKGYGTAVADGHAPGLGAIIVLTIRLPAFGSNAVPSHRRRAGTI